jgi:hypothetical protein
MQRNRILLQLPAALLPSADSLHRRSWQMLMQQTAAKAVAPGQGIRLTAPPLSCAHGWSSLTAL